VDEIWTVNVVLPLVLGIMRGLKLTLLIRTVGGGCCTSQDAPGLALTNVV
jgi:hypothetical protein